MKIKKRAMFAGRWQPVHSAHKWLVEQKLNEGVPALICVYDVPPDSEHPFTTSETMHMLELAFEGQDVIVMRIPEVESINYGPEPEYEIIQHNHPRTKKKRPASVSVSQIREQLKEGEHEWRQCVDPKIQGIVHSILLRK